MNSKTYYRLGERDHLVRNSFVAEGWDLKGLQRDDFLRGQEVAGWPDGVSFKALTVEADGDLDDFVVNNAMAPLITSRLLHLLA